MKSISPTILLVKLESFPSYNSCSIRATFCYLVTTAVLLPGLSILFTHARRDTAGLILGLRPASEKRPYKVTPSLTGWAQP